MTTHPVDLDRIKATYLTPCGPHDLDVPGPCNCPPRGFQGDMAALVDEVRASRAAIARLRGEAVRMAGALGGAARAEAKAVREAQNADDWTEVAYAARAKAAKWRKRAKRADARAAALAERIAKTGREHCEVVRLDPESGPVSDEQAADVGLDHDGGSGPQNGGKR